MFGIKFSWNLCSLWQEISGVSAFGGIFVYFLELICWVPYFRDTNYTYWKSSLPVITTSFTLTASISLSLHLPRLLWNFISISASIFRHIYSVSYCLKFVWKFPSWNMFTALCSSVTALSWINRVYFSILPYLFHWCFKLYLIMLLFSGSKTLQCIKIVWKFKTHIARPNLRVYHSGSRR